MIQKIIKAGNSLALTIPKSFIEETGYKAGDQVVVEHDPTHRMLLVKPRNKKQFKSLSPEFFEWLDEISEEYEEAIKELAKR